MMKRFVSLILALTLLVGLCPAALTAGAAASDFTDVSDRNWFYDAVDYVSENGLFKGISATMFSPKTAVDRGMFVTVLGRLADVDVSQYKKSYFYDVKTTDYFSPYVQWAASYEVAAGTGDYLYAPGQKIQRQQIAAMLYRFAKATGNDVTRTDGILTQFPDASSVSSYAKEAMEWAVTHSVVKGSDGKLQPQKSATRAEVAQIFYNIQQSGLLASTKMITQPIKLPDPPAKPVSTFKEPVNINTTLNGVALSGIELDPACFDIFPVLANNRIYSSQSASSLARNNGAYVAVNGAFFQSYSSEADYLANWSTIIRNGQIIRMENPKNTSLDPKPAFVVDSQGKASIESFTTTQNITLIKDGKESGVLKNVGCNLKLSDIDATPMIYTSVFSENDKDSEANRHVVSGKVVRALQVDKNGVITKVYKDGGTNLTIPNEGYLLVERVLRWSGETFVLDCEPGDQLKISVTYNGLKAPNIISALSNGPTLVKNGVAHTQRAQYLKEGVDDPKIIDGSNTRMAIGVKRNGQVVIVSATATLASLANAMKSLGCKDAMLFDGGASRFLYVNGSERISAGRDLNNMLIFKKK